MARINNTQRRKSRVRFRLRNSGKPRLSVFISNKHFYVQIIEGDKTLVSCSSIKLKENLSVALAEKVGDEIAKKAVKNNISEVVFDRGSYLYHGRVKALADAARKSGLKF